MHDGAEQAAEQQFVEQMPLRHSSGALHESPASRTQSPDPLHDEPAVLQPVSVLKLPRSSHVPGTLPLHVRQVPHVVELSLQQRPSMQLPEAHSVPLEHIDPLISLQTPPAAQV